MSKKRYISDSIWTDPWFETQSPQKKLLFMYLLTNKLVAISWFYEITLRQISFDTWISQSDVNKYISDFENDKKVFYHDGMICIVNFVKNQNIKSEEDNMWKGIQREILELWEEKLIGMLNYKGLIRVLQGAYKVVPIPYLTLLNSTLPNSTWPYEEFEAHQNMEIIKIEDKEIQNANILKNEYQENISFMKRQAENINNWVSPDIPDFVQEVHEEAWAKFLLYWTSPTKSWKLLCDDTKQKSFDIKRRFVTWIWNNTSTSSYSQPKKNLICKL